MTVRPDLTKDSIDLAIVTNDLAKMVGFYRDVLGFDDDGVAPTRATKGGSVHRLRCGSSAVKLVSYDGATPRGFAGGGVRAATGYRYCTIHVANLQAIIDECRWAGAPIAVPIKEISPGVTVAIVEDPDGNWVEFLSADCPPDNSGRSRKGEVPDEDRSRSQAV